jgi:hypothetical protein
MCDERSCGVTSRRARKWCGTGAGGCFVVSFSEALNTFRWLDSYFRSFGAKKSLRSDTEALRVRAPATMATTLVVAHGVDVRAACVLSSSSHKRRSTRAGVIQSTFKRDSEVGMTKVTSSIDLPKKTTPTRPAKLAKRCPFPMHKFVAKASPPSGRFLWASRGISSGTGLKPLNIESDWFGEDFGIDAISGREDSSSKITKKQTKWAKEMRVRHALIDSPTDLGCVVWNHTAAPAAEALLPKMCDWLVKRYPTKYVRTLDGGVKLPALNNYKTGPLTTLKGLDALKTCAKLVQEDLCFVRETIAGDDDGADVGCDASSGDGRITGDDRNGDTIGEDTDSGVATEDSSRHTTLNPDTVPKHTFEAGVVCFSFDPRQRHGATLAELHAPVPGYEEKMKSAVGKVFANLTTKKPLWRANWALQNNNQVISTALEWHPSNLAIGGVAMRKTFANVSDDDDAFADQHHVGFQDPLSELPKTKREAGHMMHLRVEYETVFRLPGPERAVSRWILFTVKTHLDPISELDDDTKGSLLTAINESDEHELSYKSLGNTTVLGSVVGYLDGRGGGDRSCETVYFCKVNPLPMSLIIQPSQHSWHSFNRR